MTWLVGREADYGLTSADTARLTKQEEESQRMEKRDFLRMVQHRTARVAVSASATRGQGAGGVVESARDFLSTLKLAQFQTKDQRTFARRLNAVTKRLVARLPKRATSWGLARKLLNIFLRNSLYTTYLAREYGLATSERFLEIPLDSITARRIRQKAPALPRWLGVKHLDPDRSTAYQAAALAIAGRKGVARVHLDTFWWGARKG
jgi:hypothetical protein